MEGLTLPHWVGDDPCVADYHEGAHLGTPMFSLFPTLSLTLRTTAPRLSAAPSAALLPPDASPVNFWLLADRDADLAEDDAAVGAYW